MGWQIGVMVMSDSTEPLAALLTFYEKANLALRIALLITVFWPFSVIGAAMALNPATAQTVVPIVDLIPLAAVFFLIIGAPFGLMALLSNPTARKGLTWLAALIGVELTIGVYFSTIPVSKDIGLVPLLILASLAMLFLRIGGIAGTLTKTLALLIIGITFIFIFGGRKRVEKQLDTALNPPHRPAPIIEEPPPRPAIEQSSMKPAPRPNGPVGGVSAPATPSPITSGPVAAAKNVDQLNGPPRSGSLPAESPPITSGPVVATKNADVFHFGFWPCQRAAAATFCVGFLENESAQGANEGVLPSDVRDDLGNDYAFNSFTINGSSCYGRRGGCWPDIGAKDSQEIKFQVDSVVPQATSLVLLIHLTTHGSPFALPPGFDNTQAQDFAIRIPIGKAQ